MMFRQLIDIAEWCKPKSRAEMNRRVEFLVIGAQKAGTSALDYYLRQHPSICMPSDHKELHFFDNERLMSLPAWYARARYHRHFYKCGECAILGEVTPRYIFKETYISRIYSYNPSIKLIVSLRDPVWRAYSQWNMERQRGSEEREFLDAFHSDVLTLDNPQERAYVQRGLYAKQLESVFRFFPKRQVLVIRQDELQANPVVVLDMLAAFLAINPFPNVTPKAVHQRQYSSSLSPELLVGLRRVFHSDLLRLEKMLNWNLEEWK